MHTTLPAFGLLISLCAGVGVAAPIQSPGVPSAVADLRSTHGAALVRAAWKYVDARIVPATNRAPAAGSAERPVLETHDIAPRINTPEFESAAWQDVAPSDLERRRTAGRLAFGWYRVGIELPTELQKIPVEGSAVVLELVVDDYAEVWVNGVQPRVLGERSPLISGWNTPTRVLLTSSAMPGQRFDVSIFASNGPLSEPPANYVWIRSATIDLYGPDRAGELVSGASRAAKVDTKVDRRLPAIDEIFAPGVQAERLADGFAFTEGPVWVPALEAGSGKNYGGAGRGGFLLFSDPNQNVIHRYDPVTESVSIFRTKSGYSGEGGVAIGEYHQPGSNGLAIDSQGRLTVCEHGNRRVSRLEPDGTTTPLAVGHDGKRLNSPNDLVYRSDGTLFFTDPPFGLPKAFGDPRKELPFSGVYAWRDGELHLVSTDLDAPNGLAFSPDENYLYVDNWNESRKVVMRYRVAPDGALSEGAVFADLTSVGGEICLDGLKVDARGNVYVAGPGGLWVFAPGGGHLGTLSLPELPANFTFGDADRKTLYITARTGLYRVRTGVPGALHDTVR